MQLQMSPQDCVLDAIIRARGVLADYLEPGPRDCKQTLARLFHILDDANLTEAIEALNLALQNRAAR